VIAKDNLSPPRGDEGNATALIHLLQYVRADVADASPPAGIAIDLAVALLKDKVRTTVAG
jgi:hypothetical protein